MTKILTISVAYSGNGQIFLETFALPENSTVADAVHQARQNPAFPTPFPEHVSFAIFGCATTLDAPLNDGDRVEILRPLQRDPKEARRQRASR